MLPSYRITLELVKLRRFTYITSKYWYKEGNVRHLASYWRRVNFKLSVAITTASLLAGALSVAFPLLTHADTGTWVDGDTPVLHIVQQIASPPLANDCVPTTWTYFSYTKPDGSFDSIGRNVNTSVCTTENPLGSYGGAATGDDYEFIKPNTATAFRVLNVLGRQGAVTPIPGQPTFITKDPSQNSFGEVAPHFYDSFPSAGSFGPFSYGSGFQTQEPNG